MPKRLKRDHLTVSLLSPQVVSLNQPDSSPAVQAGADTYLLTRDLQDLKGTICFMKFLYFLNGLTTSTWGRFGAIYYMLKGLTPKQIGLIEGFMPAVRAMATFFWGYIADMTKKKKIVFFITRVLSTGILVMLAFDVLAPDFAHIFIISLGSQAFTSGSLLDAWTMDMLGEHGKTQYGKIRLWMAVSWGLGAFGMSYICDHYGFNWNFIVYGSLAAMSVFLILSFVPAKTPVEQVLGDAAPKLKDAYNALCTIPVIAFLTEMLIMGMGIGVVEKLLFIYLKEDLGANTLLCGTSVLTTVSFELPIFYAMDWLNRNFGYDLLLMGAQVCYVVRVWSYTLLQPYTKEWILLIEVLHGFTFGLLWCGAKEYQRVITPLGWQGTFSSLLWMIYGSVGSGTGAIVGGYLFEIIGARNTYKGAGALVGMLLAIRIIGYFFSFLRRCFKKFCRRKHGHLNDDYRIN